MVSTAHSAIPHSKIYNWKFSSAEFFHVTCLYGEFVFSKDQCSVRFLKKRISPFLGLYIKKKELVLFLDL